MKVSRWYRWTAAIAVAAVIVVALHTCGIGSRVAERDPGEQQDAKLTLQTVTLEQPDENGVLLWRLKAKSVNYSPDNQRAELKELDGEFFQDGETIYTVVADEGEVRQNGETLFLRGNLVATNKANELTLEGERLKWQPKQDKLVMGAFEDEGLLDEDLLDDASSKGAASNDRAKPDGDADPKIKGSVDKLTTDDLLSANSAKPPVRGFDPRIEAIANLVTVVNKENRVELTGGGAAKSKEAPWLTFQADSLTWLTEQARIETDEPLKVEQYESKDYQVVSDRIVGQTGQVDLAKNIVTLDQSVELDSLSQPLKVKSERAVWDVNGQTVALNKPVNIEQPTRKITASANQGSLDLAKEVVYLTGDVKANGEKNDARLAADQVTWQTGSQDVEAQGNVTYQQAANPEISMAGTGAVGNLEKGNFVVTGGESNDGDVVIEFVPE
ncbi:MAG: LPS export ABC transporter periplasmic protein LptC [Phormidesmis sp.]